jgi:hypothetical protein
MSHKRDLLYLTRLIVGISVATSICFIQRSQCIEDDLQFLMKWPGALPEMDMSKLETLDIMTSGKEKYKCTIPVNLPEDDKEEDENQVFTFFYAVLLTLEDRRFKQLFTKKNLNENSIKTSSLINDNIHAKKLCSYRV